MSFASRLLKKVGGQRDHDPNNSPQSAYYPPPPASPYQQPAATGHGLSNVPQSAFYPTPSAFPYQLLAAPQVALPSRTNVAPTTSSPPPLPSRQHSSPHQFTSLVPHASQSLQPYDPSTQQGWLANTLPTSHLRPPSPQPPPISPSLQSLATLQPSAEVQSMSEPQR